MQTKTLALAALATTVFAQNGTNSLNDTLASQPSLSNLTSFLANYPQLQQQLGSMNNMTILAPNNDAFSHWINSSVANAIGKEDALIQGILTYHVLNGTHPNITETTFFKTALQPPQYCNVTGGQVVQAVPSGNNVTFYSGSLDNSTLASSQALNFSGGVVHIIDRFLNLPVPAINTAESLNLTAVSGVIQNLGLTNRLDDSADVTLFLPNNDAFQAVGNILANATNDTLSSIVTYHAVVGNVLYSTDLKNGSSYRTTQGQNVTIRNENGDTYVNGAKVLIPDILTNNGVIHVIEEVLNPQNASQTPDTSASTEVGFADATSVSNVPFTSGVTAPSSVIATSSINSVRSSAIASASSSNNNGNGGSGSSSGNWAPKQTGAVGAAALFGGAAVFLNM